MRRRPLLSRPAFTLIELVLVLALAGIVAAMGVNGFLRYRDRIAVHNAVAEAASVVAQARSDALAQRTLVTLRIDTAARTLTLRTRDGPLVTHALGHAHGVSLASSRDSVSFDARGLGYGAANFTLVARRGQAADTLVVSRLGRTRYRS
jgi:prepilin-type N-terminal cleavage/methylation domain-containing protein